MANVKEVLEVIDFEINQIITQQTKPGWTKWAIGGALFTTISLLIQNIEDSKINIFSHFLFILNPFLAVSFIRLGLSAIYSAFTSYENQTSKFKRFKIGLFSDRRQIFLFGIPYFSFLIYVVLISNEQFYFQKFLTLFLLFSILLLLLLGFILSFFRLPFLSGTSKSRLGIAASFIYSALFLYGAAGYFSAVAQFNVSDILYIKLGGLLFCVLFLLELVVANDVNTIMLSSLIDIRRNLVFQEINENDALKLAEIAVFGLKVADVFQKDIGEILKIFSDLLNLYEKCNHNIKAVQELLKTPVLDMKAPIQAILREYVQDNETIVAISRELRKKIESLADRIIWVKKLDNNANQELKRITDELKNHVTVVQEKRDQNDKVWQNIKKQITDNVDFKDLLQ